MSRCGGGSGGDVDGDGDGGARASFDWDLMSRVRDKQRRATGLALPCLAIACHVHCTITMLPNVHPSIFCQFFSLAANTYLIGLNRALGLEEFARAARCYPSCSL